MPLNTSIPLQIRPIDWVDESQKQASLRQMIDQARMAPLRMRQAELQNQGLQSLNQQREMQNRAHQRDEDEAAVIAQATRDFAFDPNAKEPADVIRRLAATGKVRPQTLAAMQKQILDAQRSRSDAEKAKEDRDAYVFGQHADVFAPVLQMPEERRAAIYAAGRANLIGRKLATPEQLPEQLDVGWLEPKIATWMGAQKWSDWLNAQDTAKRAAAEEQRRAAEAQRKTEESDLAKVARSLAAAAGRSRDEYVNLRDNTPTKYGSLFPAAPPAEKYSAANFQAAVLGVATPASTQVAEIGRERRHQETLRKKPLVPRTPEGLTLGEKARLDRQAQAEADKFQDQEQRLHERAIRIGNAIAENDRMLNQQTAKDKADRQAGKRDEKTGEWIPGNRTNEGVKFLDPDGKPRVASEDWGLQLREQLKATQRDVVRLQARQRRGRGQTAVEAPAAASAGTRPPGQPAPAAPAAGPGPARQSASGQQPQAAQPRTWTLDGKTFFEGQIVIRRGGERGRVVGVIDGKLDVAPID